MAPRKELPNEHHVLRYVPPSKRFVDADGVRQGPSLGGFKLRANDKGGLSVTEVERFGVHDPEAWKLAACAHRESLQSKELKLQGIFACGNVGYIKSEAQRYDKHVRVVHDPVAGNPAHAEIRHFTDDDLDILEHFASHVFAKYEVVADMNLPPWADDRVDS